MRFAHSLLILLRRIQGAEIAFMEDFIDPLVYHGERQVCASTLASMLLLV